MVNKDLEYKSKYEVISKLIHLLYDLPGCGTGGMCHIVTDDDNIYDEDLKFVIEYCNREENKDRIDKEISILICSLLLELSFEKRVILFEIHTIYGCVDQELWKQYIDHEFTEGIVKEYDYQHKFYKE